MVLDRIQQLRLEPLLFLLLIFNTVSLLLGENEEEYFAFARTLMEPGWIPGAHSVIDVPGTRIIFDTSIGFLLKYFSFEQIAVAGRSLLAFLFAFPLAKIFRRLRLDNISSLFLLQFICAFDHQSFFGKEWIFLNFETKALAYVFVFYSLYNLLNTRHLRSVVFAAVAIYFHILVGGWYILILFVYLLLSGIPVKQLLRYAFLVLIITAPFGIYLGNSYLLDNPGIINGINITRVYDYYRNPHHLNVVSDLLKPGSTAQIGVTLSLLAFAWCWRIYSGNGEQLHKRLALVSMVTFSQQFISLLIAALDSSGNYLEFYPYRTSALSFFTVLLLIVAKMQNHYVRAGSVAPAETAAVPQNAARSVSRYTLVIFLIMGLLLLCRLGRNTYDSYQVLNPGPESQARIELYRWIKGHTGPEDVFLNMNRRVRDDLDFTRKTLRERFSVYKFVPTTNELIYDWYVRSVQKHKILDDFNQLEKALENYRIDYVVSKSSLDSPLLEEVFHNDYYSLYRIKSRADSL